MSSLKLATYLIDYENHVGHAFIAFADKFMFPPCSRLCDGYKTREKTRPCVSFWETVKRKHCNRVALFYSGNSPQANIGTIKTHCTEAYEYVPNGVKNGLDLQLATYLGRELRGKDGLPADGTFYIVSGDKGFSSVVKFWNANEKNATVEHLTSEADFISALESKTDFISAVFRDELRALNISAMLRDPNHPKDINANLKEIDKANKKANDIISTFFKETDKKLLHNKLQQITENGEHCKAIYKAIRPIFNIYRKLINEESA